MPETIYPAQVSQLVVWHDTDAGYTVYRFNGASIIAVGHTDYNMPIAKGTKGIRGLANEGKLWYDEKHAKVMQLKHEMEELLKQMDEELS